jgi:hypothetical protein
MKRNWVIANSLLLALALVLGYQLRRQWKSYQTSHQIALLKPAASAGETIPASAVKPAGPPNYSTIVDNHLFVIDRNNIVPPEPAPPPESKVTAPKPILMGIMGLSGNSYALMVSAATNESSLYRRLRIGEQLDGYTLTKLFPDKVLMNADGKDVEVRLNERPKVALTQGTAAAASGGTGAHVTSLEGMATTNTTQNVNASTARPPETPEGTVVNGKRKKIVPSPFGPTVVWEDVK